MGLKSAFLKPLLLFYVSLLSGARLNFIQHVVAKPDAAYLQ